MYTWFGLHVQQAEYITEREINNKQPDCERVTATGHMPLTSCNVGIVYHMTIWNKPCMCI